ncbi:MAG TPA: phage minor capsid protein [Amycolatopsis sp.]|jgi:hypothetical protein|nr:phage minor capsid protein [Amycolatopsis sp.]
MATAEHFPYEQGLTDFNRTVAAAQREIALQVEAAINAGNLNLAGQRRLQLARVIATLDQLGAYVDPTARQLVADAYQQAAARTVDQITALNITAPEIPGAFAGVSTEAVAALQRSITGKLTAARDTVGRQVDDIYAREGRRIALRAILGADGSPQAARRQLALSLRQQGLTGFVDKAGKNWKLDTYSEMVARTVTREAVAQGAMDRMASHGITIARWSTHGDACPICTPWLGRLVSLDGTTSDFDGEAVADLGSTPGVPAHPNCKCTLSPVATRIEQIRRELAGVGT